MVEVHFLYFQDLFYFLIGNNFCTLWISFFNLWHLFISEKIICVYVFIPTGESVPSYLSKNVLALHDQDILLGTTYRIIANALSREPACLAEIEESKARRILDLSGSGSEDAEKVMNTGGVNLLCVCVVCL